MGVILYRRSLADPDAEVRFVSSWLERHSERVLSDDDGPIVLTEQETGDPRYLGSSRYHFPRIRLGEAIRLSRVHGAILLIAKMDALIRNLDFLVWLSAETSGSWRAADYPDFSPRQMITYAEVHKRRIAVSSKPHKAPGKGTITAESHRRRGESLRRRHREWMDNARPIVLEMTAYGLRDASQIAAALNARCVPNWQNRRWTKGAVRKLLLGTVTE